MRPTDPPSLRPTRSPTSPTTASPTFEDNGDGVGSAAYIAAGSVAGAALLLLARTYVVKKRRGREIVLEKKSSSMGGGGAKHVPASRARPVSITKGFSGVFNVSENRDVEMRAKGPSPRNPAASAPPKKIFNF